ncbi:MAG: restriction endonuclease subunit S [Chloroflexota bacterium]|nr:restriction endonuclease subunit S [Chloroflexota bacterium]
MDAITFPSHWTQTHLGSLGDIYGGSTPSTIEPDYWGGDIAWVTPSEATKCSGLFISETRQYITQKGLKNCAARLLPIGSVLITSRATIGKTIINTVPMATNQGFINVVCHDGTVFNEFVAYWIELNKSILEGRAYGVTFKEIIKSNFKTIPIALPPLPEQRAIAGVLRAVQEAGASRRAEAGLERERKAALMAHLFTHGTRGEAPQQTALGPLPASWPVVRLGDYCYKPGYGYTESATIEPIGPKFLRITDITEDGVNWRSTPYCACDSETRKKYLLKAGDLVVARIGATTGKAYLLGECPEAVFASYLIRIRPKPQLSSLFLSFYFQSNAYWLQIDQNKGGKLKGGVNIPILQSLVLPLPSLPEQEEIAAVLRTCDRKIAALVQEAAALDELFRALLADLMSGRRSARPLLDPR